MSRLLSPALALLITILARAARGGHAARPTAPPDDGRMRPSGVTVVPAAAADADPRALGDPAAPITIVEYSDFQ
jgi:protein-disulfide isomerase